VSEPAHEGHEGPGRARDSARNPDPPRGTIPRWRSEQLLRGHRQAEIEHAGQRYRLQLTGNGKLILVK
jgi:hemin uptake protein HemP